MAPTTTSASNDEVAGIIKHLLDKLAGMALSIKSQAARPSTAFASYDRDEVRTQLDREANLLSLNVTKLSIYLNEPPYDPKEATVLCNDLYGVVERISCIVDAVPITRGRQLLKSLNDLLFDLLAALASLIHSYIMHLGGLAGGTKKQSFATTGQVWDIAVKLKDIPLSAKEIAAKELTDILDLLNDAVAEVEQGGDDDLDGESEDEADTIVEKVESLAVDGDYDEAAAQIVKTQGLNLLKLNKFVFLKLKKRCLVDGEEDTETTVGLVDGVADLCRELSEEVDEFAAALGERQSRKATRAALASFSEKNLALIGLGKQFSDEHTEWFETAEKKWIEVAEKLAAA